MVFGVLLAPLKWGLSAGWGSGHGEITVGPFTVFYDTLD